LNAHAPTDEDASTFSAHRIIIGLSELASATPTIPTCITTSGKSASPENQGAQPCASSTPAADQPKANSGNGFVIAVLADGRQPRGWFNGWERLNRPHKPAEI
jgi:hypothetical protein